MPLAKLESRDLATRRFVGIPMVDEIAVSWSDIVMIKRKLIADYFFWTPIIR